MPALEATAALRLMEMAERFNNMPIITFIDTPRLPVKRREERGYPEAIARNLRVRCLV